MESLLTPHLDQLTITDHLNGTSDVLVNEDALKQQILDELALANDDRDQFKLKVYLNFFESRYGPIERRYSDDRIGCLVARANVNGDGRVVDTKYVSCDRIHFIKI